MKINLSMAKGLIDLVKNETQNSDASKNSLVVTSGKGGAWIVFFLNMHIKYMQWGKGYC